MNPLDLLNLYPLMNISEGSPEINIGLIDGPIDITHPSFENSTIIATNQSDLETCKSL